MIGTSSEQETTDIPVLYLLHGMGGNHSVWERRTSIERYVADYGLAVIMPSTDLGWYTDTVYDMKYWTFIAEELPEICHELFPQLTRKREKTYAAGLSMGGYGALKLGLAKSENFAAVISLSGAVSVGNRMDDLLMVRKAAFWEGIFGPLDQIEGSKNDPQYLLKELVKSGKPVPRFYMACGESDFLIRQIRKWYLLCRNKAWRSPLNKDLAIITGSSGDQWIQRALAWLMEEKIKKES